MGWGSGIDHKGREVGYLIEDTCHAPGCTEKIDRGLAYRCGGVSNLHSDDVGCGNFFCGDHLTGCVRGVVTDVEPSCSGCDQGDELDQEET